MKLSVKKIREGEQYPRGYGFAYYDYLGGFAYCYPIGLNWIVNIGRHIWFALLNPPSHKIDDVCAKAYQKGREDLKNELLKGVK